MIDFNKEDVLTIAKALVKDPVEYEPEGYRDLATPYYYCTHCFNRLIGYNVNKKDFKHENHCPVLVAQDILTRN